LWYISDEAVRAALCGSRPKSLALAHSKTVGKKAMDAQPIESYLYALPFADFNLIHKNFQVGYDMTHQ
jgi:hypothetical protein